MSSSKDTKTAITTETKNGVPVEPVEGVGPAKGTTDVEIDLTGDVEIHVSTGPPVSS